MPSTLAVCRLMTSSNLTDCKYRQVGGLGTLKYAGGINADLMRQVRKISPIAHQPAGCYDFTNGISGRNPVARRQRGELRSPAAEERVGCNEEGVETLAHKGGEGGINLTDRRGIENLSLPSDAGSGPPSPPVTWTSALEALAGLTSTATRTAFGTRSCRSRSRLATTSLKKSLMPVALPPGRAKLATRPSWTGSSPTPNTIGIVEVAALAASAAGALPLWRSR